MVRASCASMCLGMFTGTQQQLVSICASSGCSYRKPGSSFANEVNWSPLQDKYSTLFSVGMVHFSTITSASKGMYAFQVFGKEFQACVPLIYSSGFASPKAKKLCFSHHTPVGPDERALTLHEDDENERPRRKAVLLKVHLKGIKLHINLQPKKLFPLWLARQHPSPNKGIRIPPHREWKLPQFPIQRPNVGELCWNML